MPADAAALPCVQAGDLRVLARAVRYLFQVIVPPQVVRVVSIAMLHCPSYHDGVVRFRKLAYFVLTFLLYALLSTLYVLLAIRYAPAFV